MDFQTIYFKHYFYQLLFTLSIFFFKQHLIFPNLILIYKCIKSIYTLYDFKCILNIVDTRN